MKASWEISDQGKRARYYQLTRTGRAELAGAHSRWDALSRAMNLVLRPTGEVDQ